MATSLSVVPLQLAVLPISRNSSASPCFDRIISIHGREVPLHFSCRGHLVIFGAQLAFLALSANTWRAFIFAFSVNPPS
jgi:hypothetical protein